jgi:hypothetical protein
MGTDRTMKRAFLTVYDYGTGGVWTVLLATSEEEVESKYPELKVVTEPPATMSQGELEEIRARDTLDIDDEDDPFLTSLREARKES